ncbi:hypothetical protein PILCRDRAFT_828931 [Piloderma croceum F 1598]|uniref:SAP domain-containing protein n=1 Tax=Piloderma croceum (strain F 1598) TaxID=765440 RepID=A0A0C3F0G7_PILCF|nr:hypothetical protein PILCRDRAFT_828931 [Piloderma croceum F 1598]
MSTTTQILFNSPALHALKRDQLLKLCKIHSLKANGKNVELVERLKEHAKTLPCDNPLSVAARSERPMEEDDEDGTRGRPSEQWEMVMDTIQESRESSGSRSSTLRSTNSSTSHTIVGEFGTGGGSKSSSLNTSIKALASSLGLKRPNTSTNTQAKSNLGLPTDAAPSYTFPNHRNTNILNKLSSKTQNDYLATHSIPYSSLAEPDRMPQTDHFTLSIPDPDPIAPSTDPDQTPPTNHLPGHPLHPGLPAPQNARLSLDLTPRSENGGPSTTIRLVGAGSSYPLNTKGKGEGEVMETPKLMPFETAFDLVVGTPFGGGVSVWPASPTAERVGGGIYPSLAGERVGNSRDTYGGKDEGEDVEMPGAFTAPRFTLPTPTTHAPKPPSPEPFIFGSTLPQNNISNAQFSDAAASVLGEMNKRLREAGVEAVGMDILERRGSLGGTTRKVAGVGGRGGGGSGGKVGAMFEKMHEEAFGKMEGIDTHYAARRAGPAKEEGAASVVGKKRKSDAMGIGKGLPKSVGVGVRVNGTRTISNGVRKRMGPASFVDEGEGVEEDGADAESSMRHSKRPRFEKGRRVSIAPLPTPHSQEREGEMNAEEREREAKRLLKEREAIKRKLEMNKKRRRSSMGRPSLGGKGLAGVSQKAKGQAPTSKFGFLSSAAKSLVKSVWNKGTGAGSSKGGTKPTPKPAAPPVPKKTVVDARPSASSASGSVNKAGLAATNRNRIASASTSSRSGNVSMLKPSSSTTTRIRSPLPSFGGGSTSSRAGSTLIPSSRSGTGTGGSRFGTRSSSMTSGVSSMGARSKVSSVAGGVSSLGTRGSSASVNNAASAVGSIGIKRTGSAATGLNTSVRSRASASVSSRLLAPTASSLAKAQTGGPVPPPKKSPALSAVSENQASGSSKPALGQITNSPTVHQPESPRAVKIFSHPLSPSTQDENPSLRAAAAALAPARKPLVATAKAKVLLPTRKPRISRSKVIAKLASQRVGSSAMSGGGKVRSSMGVGMGMDGRKRQGFGGAKMGRGSAVADSAVHMSAKKRMRQSEYARRRSRAPTSDLPVPAPVPVDGPSDSGAMYVDAKL